MGTTPYTWENPFFGGMNITVSKSGFEDASRSFEYLGGEKRESFALAPAPQQRAPEPTPAPAASAPAPQQSAPAPAAAPSAPPQTAAAEPPPPSQPTGEPASIFISSLPPVAEVYMDGKLIGKTNVAELKVRSGSHTMKFVKGGKEITKEMTFQPGKNPSQMIRIP
jgi:hypothetical protein